MFLVGLLEGVYEVSNGFIAVPDGFMMVVYSLGFGLG